MQAKIEATKIRIEKIAMHEYHSVIDQYLSRLSQPEKGIASQIVFGSTAISNLQQIVFSDSVAAGLKEAFENNLDNPIIIDLIKHLTTNYAHLLCEAIDNSNQHIEQIKREFFGIDSPNTLLVLKEVDIQNSDPHKNGKRLVFLSYETKETRGWTSVTAWQKWFKPQTLKLVYKPTNLNVDSAITGTSGFLALAPVKQTLQERGIQNPLTYKIMPYDNYGFIQFLSHQLKDYQLKDEAEINNYSYTQGIIAAVSMMFGIDDRHVENIFVTEKIPKLIDLETSFSPAVTDLSSTYMLQPATGALTPKIKDCAGKSLNSIAIDQQDYVIIPKEEQFLAGLQDGLKLVSQYGENFIDELNSSPAIFMTRYVPAATQEFTGPSGLINGHQFRMMNMSGEKLRSELEMDVVTKTNSRIESSLVQLSSAIEASKTGNLELLAATNLHQIKYDLLIATNPDSMIRDIEQGDVPYFAFDIRNGQLQDSRGQILIWDRDKVMHKLEDLGVTKPEEREVIFHQLNSLPSPLALTILHIRKLHEELLINSGDITQCSTYTTNALQATKALRSAIADKPQLLPQKQQTQQPSGKFGIITLIISFLAGIFMLDGD